MTVTLEIPLPPRGCSSNGPHGYWAGSNAARQEYRADAFYAAREKRAPKLCGLVRVSVVCYTAPGRIPGRYRPKDEQNLISALKSAIDGLVDAAVIEGDDAERLTWGRTELRAPDRSEGRAGVVITLEEVRD